MYRFAFVWITVVEALHKMKRAQERPSTMCDGFVCSLHDEFTYRDYPDDAYSGSLWRGTHLKQKRRENMRRLLYNYRTTRLYAMSRDSEHPKFWRNADKDILEALQ